MRNMGSVGPKGALAIQRIAAVPAPGDGAIGVIRSIALGLPWFGLPREILVWRIRNIPNLWRGSWRCFVAAFLRVPFVYGRLHLRVIRADGTILDYGVASLRVVTATGAGYLVDAMENLVEPELLKFHGIGTGSTAEATTDTALVTELTTAYNPDNTRATGSLTETSSNIFRTVGTNTVDAGASITEHGILTQAATGGGVLLDRSVFTAVALANGDSLQSTYDFTINTGG